LGGLGHRSNVALASGERVDAVAGAAAAEELRDDVRVEHRAAHDDGGDGLGQHRRRGCCP
jgi:hypothetical protein